MANTVNPMPDEVRVFVVQALACFDPPSMIVAAVKEEFGFAITPQGVQAYDPNKHAGRNLSAKWRTLFESSRKSFLENTSAIPIANRASRLRALQRMAEKAERVGNMQLAIAIHKQAAEEVGDAFTNRHKFDHTSSDRSMSPAGLSALYGDDEDSDKNQGE